MMTPAGYNPARAGLQMGGWGRHQNNCSKVNVPHPVLSSVIRTQGNEEEALITSFGPKALPRKNSHSRFCFPGC